MFLSNPVITKWTSLLKYDRESSMRQLYRHHYPPPPFSVKCPTEVHPQLTQLTERHSHVLPCSDSSRPGGHHCLPITFPKWQVLDYLMHLLSPLNGSLGLWISSACSKDAPSPLVLTAWYTVITIWRAGPWGPTSSVNQLRSSLGLQEVWENLLTTEKVSPSWTVLEQPHWIWATLGRG